MRRLRDGHQFPRRSLGCVDAIFNAKGFAPDVLAPRDTQPVGLGDLTRLGFGGALLQLPWVDAKQAET